MGIPWVWGLGLGVQGPEWLPVMENRMEKNMEH